MEVCLPHTFRSPWRWVGVVIGAGLAFVGASGFTASQVQRGDMAVAGALVAFGLLVIYASWRSGVLVDREHLRHRVMGVGTDRVRWVDVADVKIVRGPSILPSRAVTLVNKNGDDEHTLTSLSWYQIRSREPRRVARVVQVATILIERWELVT
ncbi:hypothetical protein [Actinophytocola oryzae]|uniref:PH (Pleckstrin Homology) domain-containing protein n=1 Tax=Actinophytocola oryzae TaxID=502181 RepID=A0A4R7UWK4_9PSEU|nr:hypothetical protein [Actinophytocola oryzae]TDV40474.1 hypothetical protein CLV71_123185 [Actinophytocola oryzae]